MFHVGVLTVELHSSEFMSEQCFLSVLVSCQYSYGCTIYIIIQMFLCSCSFMSIFLCSVLMAVNVLRTVVVLFRVNHVIVMLVCPDQNVANAFTR